MKKIIISLFLLSILISCTEKYNSKKNTEMLNKKNIVQEKNNFREDKNIEN
jgi:hypothetical protein